MGLIIRNSGQEGVVNVKNPGVLGVTLDGATPTEKEPDFLHSPLGVRLVLRRSHVLLDVFHTFLGHHGEAPDVVDLHVHPPALAVALQVPSKP